ncbi:hypothetical protein JAB5_48800 [Janthinobacterium sp. HH103]|uniref:hypothetical protein n=1 Tax=unclassified Janthinobacterium TaxID=2610881 RepID=UPI0008938767|nr:MULTISPECIES: hypothetical protein [unclassified Janthinobacterium]OEZ68036.1 hypothetical protein JAB2_20390 [Janthinobacterium sp. HH100]OEZ68462.1 hypothetical protein JAB5_48800 [Janthinobacterium sp. HH103]QOU75841.1 hypothetical protein JAB4_053290 [Janthinobacterium sp. HH102]
MARHHVISTTACDVFFKLVAHQKKSLGARFDSMIVTFSADGQPVLGATLRNATSGCELHRLAGQPDECWCCGYDEQLEFVSQNKVPLAHADYRLTLSNGETWTGTTDAKGRTGRIASKREEQITQAEFLPHADKSPCCAAAPKHAAPAVKLVPLEGIKTTDKDVGSSVKQVKVKDKVRPLTRGEIDMAWMLFQDAIDYGKVKVHGEPYLWFGLQPKNVAMTPDGEIYFHESEYREDFSKEDDHRKHWFIHEMVHIWQYQLNYPVKIRGAIRLGLDYTYILLANQKLADHNMEAQGDLIADYFVLKFLDSTEAMVQQKYKNSQKTFEEVLGDFFKNRKSPKNLPGNNIDHEPLFDIP